MKLSAFFGHNIARETGGGGRRRDEPKAEQIIVLRSRILRNYCLEGLFHTVPSSFVLHCTCKRTQQFTMLHLFPWGKKFDRFQTLRNNTQQYATGCANGQNMQLATVLGVVGQHCRVRLQRSFIDQSYFGKKKHM